MSGEDEKWWRSNLESTDFSERLQRLMRGENVVANSLPESLEYLRIIIRELATVVHQAHQMTDIGFQNLQTSLDGVQAELRNKASQTSVDTLQTEMREKASQKSVDAVDTNVRAVLTHLRAGRSAAKPR